jgi:predicted kinase
MTLTRGLPGSGKTTAALALLDATPGTVRLNRDALREALYGSARVLDYPAEASITAIQHAAARQALTRGHDVVVDDCNLRARYCRAWADLAASCGADLKVIDLTDVPVDECIRRDQARGDAGGRSVGADVIRGMHQRYLAAGRLAPAAPSQPHEGSAPAVYVPDRGLPPAWLVDMDGTLALGHFGEPGRRGPFDWARVEEDDLNPPVIALVQALMLAGGLVIVVSGRSDACRTETTRWLSQRCGIHVTEHTLLMRKDGDYRPDHVVKAGLFDAHVRDAYHVVGVLDDRDTVVAMWRSMGLTCMQVAPGAF